MFAKKSIASCLENMLTSCKLNDFGATELREAANGWVDSVLLPNLILKTTGPTGCSKHHSHSPRIATLHRLTLHLQYM